MSNTREQNAEVYDAPAPESLSLAVVLLRGPLLILVACKRALSSSVTRFPCVYRANQIKKANLLACVIVVILYDTHTREVQNDKQIDR